MYMSSQRQALKFQHFTEAKGRVPVKKFREPILEKGFARKMFRKTEDWFRKYFYKQVPLLHA